MRKIFVLLMCIVFVVLFFNKESFGQDLERNLCKKWKINELYISNTLIKDSAMARTKYYFKPNGKLVVLDRGESKSTTCNWKIVIPDSLQVHCEGIKVFTAKISYIDASNLVYHYVNRYTSDSVSASKNIVTEMRLIPTR